MTPTVYFLHGRDSSPQSLKVQRLSMIAARCGWNVVTPDFSSTKDPDQRVRMFLDLGQKITGTKTVVVGSSMGAYVALVASRVVKPEAMLLLAPAVNIAGYGESDPGPVAGETTIIHGWNDELIEPAAVFHFASAHKTSLHLVKDDHALHQSLPFIETVLADILCRCSPVSRRARLTASL